ncbi:zf-CCHC domain-containing protein [Tanacetum coccineum]
MERGFLSSKGNGGGRGVKEKSGGSIDVSAKVNNGLDDGTTTSSNVAMNKQGSANVYVEYEWKPHRCMCCKVFDHVQDECPKNKVSDVVSKKNNVSTSGNNKKDAKPTKEVMDPRSEMRRTTTLVDDDGIPLTRVDSLGDDDSDDKVASVNNDKAKSLVPKDVGYGTNSLLDQWKEYYRDEDNDYEPYDDDMYDGQDIPAKIQDICDNLDIKVRGRSGFAYVSSREAKKERVKSIALKAKKESSDDETSTYGNDDEEYAMAVRNFKKFFKKKSVDLLGIKWRKEVIPTKERRRKEVTGKCFRCGDPNHLIGDCPKPSRNKDQKAFIRGSWSDSENDAEDKTNDETCLMAQSSNEVSLRTCLEPDEWIKDSGCSKLMTGNKSLFSTSKHIDGEHVDT